MTYTQERRDRAVSSPKKTLSRVFNVFCVFLIGYLTANFFNFTQLTDWVHHLSRASNRGNENVKVAVKTISLPKPKFEFYTLLEKTDEERSTPTKARAHIASATMPSKAVPATQQSANKNLALSQNANNPLSPMTKSPSSTPATVAKTNNVTTSTITAPNTVVLQSQEKNNYWIQIASFKGKPEAERLKASLALKGFDVQIKTAASNQGAWFRVLSGPYPSKNLAEKMQLTIAQNEHIHGMVYRS